MADRMTSIHLPGLRRGAGLADWGRKTPAEMTAQYRKNAQLHLDEAKAVLEAADADFHVETYVGVLVRRDRETLQEGKK